MTPTLIMTRPRAQSESFAAKVACAWGKPLTIIHSPLIEVTWVDTNPDGPDGLIFTSVNGVTAVRRMGLPNGLPAWCVGKKTAKAARDAGFDPSIGPGDAEGLIADIIAAKPPGRLAHIRGVHTRGDVAARLRSVGIACADVIAYDQQAQTLNDEAKAALAGKSPVIVPLFSSRTGVIFSEQGPYQARVYAPMISVAVRDAVGPSLVTSIFLANRPDGEAMLDVTLTALTVATTST
jgi:uroporphyrinogen-III synthase